MPLDVFISYATEDKRIADAPCAAIEARGFPLLDGSPRPAAGRPAKVRSLRGSRRIIDHIRLDTPWTPQDIVRIAGTLRRDLSCVLPSRTCLIRNGLERKG